MLLVIATTLSNEQRADFAEDGQTQFCYQRKSSGQALAEAYYRFLDDCCTASLVSGWLHSKRADEILGYQLSARTAETPAPSSAVPSSGGKISSE